MSPLAVGLLILGCVFGAALIGVFMRSILPEHHLKTESKEIVVLGAGLVATMAGVVLGLLIASEMASYDQQRDEITQMSANVLLLDRILAHYGPETKNIREQLRQTVSGSIGRIWANDPPPSATSKPIAPAGEALYDAIHKLSPTNETQRKFLEEAESTLSDLSRMRILLLQQSGSSVSVPLLIVLVFWLCIVFVCFGLFAPKNGTVIAMLFLCALAVSGAVHLLIELDRPFSGLIQISDAPLRAALAHLGQ